MAHFAKLGINGKVIGVVPFDDDRLLNADGVEDEEVGRQELENETGWPLWKQTSYNTFEGKHYTFNDDDTKTLSADQSKALRGSFAGIGMIYDEEKDLFYHKRKYDNWVWNEDKKKYIAPVTEPTHTQKEISGVKHACEWDEANNRWLAIPPGETEATHYWNVDTNTWIEL